MADSVTVNGHRRTRDYRTKPCPFCGSPAEITHYSFGGVAIGCSFCDCHAGTHETQDEAVEYWNTRKCGAPKRTGSMTDGMKSKWNSFDHKNPDTHPKEPGVYAVMIKGDSEREGPHVFYEFDDYQTFADVYRDNDSIRFKCTHGEEESSILAWYGPITIPPFVSTEAKGEEG